jgi:hypothetical protein
VKLPIIAALIILSTTGCAKVSSILGGGSKPMVNSEGKVIAGRNQNDAYVGGKQADAEAMKAGFEAKKSETEVMKVPTVVTTVTFDDENKPVFSVAVNINGSILASKQNDSLYGVKFDNNTKIPETSFAQGAKAVGGAALGLANSTGLIVGEFGYFVGSMFRAAVDKPMIRSDYVSIDDSFKETTASGNDSTIHTGGDPIPVIGEGDDEPPVETGESVYGPAPMGY